MRENKNESYEVPYKELGEMGRAIDAYVLASVGAERERIIALIKSLEDDERNRGGDWIEMPIVELVAMIKENDLGHDPTKVKYLTVDQIPDSRHSYNIGEKNE